MIIEYLFLQYRGIPALAAMLPSLSGMLRAGLVLAVRLTGKPDAAASRAGRAAGAVQLESSPFALAEKERLPAGAAIPADQSGQAAVST